MKKILTIISDCRDDNAKVRQEIRYSSLVKGITTKFIGVENDLEASGDLIDAIDAYKGRPGIIVVNVAPRGDRKKFKNGTPFCFHKFSKLVIIGTPNAFSLAKKLRLFSQTFETDVYEVCSKFLSKKEALRIAESQFRSYEYLPYLTKWILEGKKISSKKIDIQDFSNENFVWKVDSFGNCKTTATENKNLSKFSKFRFFERLADVPRDGKVAVIRGSSGYKKKFLEIIVQKSSASKKLKLKIGSIV